MRPRSLEELVCSPVPLLCVVGLLSVYIASSPSPPLPLYFLPLHTSSVPCISLYSFRLRSSVYIVPCWNAREIRVRRRWESRASLLLLLISRNKRLRATRAARTNREEGDASAARGLVRFSPRVPLSGPGRVRKLQVTQAMYAATNVALSERKRERTGSSPPVVPSSTSALSTLASLFPVRNTSPISPISRQRRPQSSSRSRPPAPPGGQSSSSPGATLSGRLTSLSPSGDPPPPANATLL